ncbi:ABC transporter substrate-binding protein [Desulfobulbus rhabdoformis]|uniref:ABC transporter substrate-binding protein n=1 Tax=Desulfobulbus rhabdoformis TaxID=34032 RepID=UPI001963B588|nr:ABC transporter substrate-binding protein [Desulfobulbus rhabdoformis]MBM9613778.1 ABC transporter substrate-binding protein [Desulfobulbus rhabdoformis]
MRLSSFASCLCLSLLLVAQLATAASITDTENRTIVFNQPFKRIISLYSAHTTNLLQLGLKKEIIGCSPSDHQLPGCPKVRFQDDPERLLALSPDLVLIRPMISRAYPNLVRILERHNVRVVSLQPTQAKELYQYWRDLGILTGHEQQAEAMVTTFTDRLKALQSQLRLIPKNRRKHVYFESMHSQMKTFAPTSMAIFVLESAGGVNVATDADRMRQTNIAAYGKERILAKANDIDLYLAQTGRMNPVRVDDIIHEPGFSVIKAVRDGQVFLVAEEMVSRPTLELLDGIAFVKSLLYPDYAQKGIIRL